MRAGVAKWLMNATATSSSGVGLFLNVDPGDHDMLLTIAGGASCKILFGGLGISATDVKVRAVAGFPTVGTINCM